MQLVTYNNIDSHFYNLFKNKIIRLDKDIEIATPSAWLLNFMDLENDKKIPDQFLSLKSNLLIIQADLESIHAYSHKTKTILEQLNNHSAASQIHLLVNSNIQKMHILKQFARLNVSLFNTWEIYTRHNLKHANINKNYEQRRFLYLNRRCSPERLYLFNLLWRNNLFKQQSYSSFNRSVYWSYEFEENQYYQNTLQETQDRSGLKTSITVDQFPSLPTYFSNQDPYLYDMYDQNLQSAYSHTSISIITESNPAHNQEQFFPTEKTFRAIALKHPFITYAQTNFYKNLKEFGYQTFDSIWNEGFDKAIDPWKRARKINKIVTQLTAMSDVDFENLVNQTKSITEHNYKTFLKRTDPNTIIKKLNKQIQLVFSSFETRSK
jgi:hypothetical protein